MRPFIFVPTTIFTICTLAVCAQPAKQSTTARSKSLPPGIRAPLFPDTDTKEPPASEPLHPTPLLTADRKIRVPGPPDKSLWWRYYQAGEDACIKKDMETAKRYWFASLNELEKNPPPKVKGAQAKDLFFLVKLSGLEKALLVSYPKDWSQLGSGPDVLKSRQEQVTVLGKIVHVNQLILPPSEGMLQASVRNYTEAKTAYEKLKEEANKPAPKPETKD